MKSCKKCFEYAYIFVGGDVRMCPWNGIVIGNLLENTLEEIWRGQKAEEVRKAFMSGELLGCSERYCPDCINKSTTLEIEKEELERLYEEMPDLPTYLSLAYDERCNHACPSCRHEFFRADEKYRSNLKVITQNIEPYLGKVSHIATNGIGDLFVSHEILDMISRFHPENPEFSMFIETNGVLFKDNWKKLEHLSEYNLTVSITPNSFDRETYRYLAGRDDLEKFEESMAFITELKHSGAINRIRIIMVIQDSNFRQIPEFVRRCIEYDADDIVLRPIFKWFGMQEDELLYKNVLNPCHPYHKEYEEIIKDPICQDPRVFNWGFEEEQEAIEFPTLEMKRQAECENSTQVYIDEKICYIRNKIEARGKGKKVYLFGAGKIGKLVLEKLTSGDRMTPIAGFAVSCADCNPKFYMGFPIIEFANIENKKDCVFILATTNFNFEDEMAELLKKSGVEDYISINRMDEENETNKKLIIFGAGRNGDDAWHFFGSENIFCFVDNNKRLIGTKLRDKKVISIGELEQLRSKQTKEFDESYEIIVSVSKTRWATLAIVDQLQKIGISDYSIYMDIRKRWKSGEEFIKRNRNIYPYEQETILEIYRVQRDYLMRHVDASHLLPATGSLRKIQLETVGRLNDFFHSIKDISISPFMIAGTLLGALRHKGFIPWDDDLDFALIHDEYVRLYDYLEKNSKIFYHRGNNIWETKEGERSCNRKYQYIVAYGLGYMQIYENIEAPHVKENLFITDIMPVYYFADGYTQEQYGREHERWYRKREENFEHVDEIYLSEAKTAGLIVKSSGKVGLGHDLTSFLKSQHDINGRRFDRKIWDADLLFPLQKLLFEGYEWYAPRYAQEWLETEGYGDPMMLPSRVGVYVHDKDRIFREKY